MYTPKKVVVWGHPLQSHTSSYVHGSFVKAFKFMGYETRWLKNGDATDGLDSADTLFLTEGQVDDLMPKRADCRYVLHNCDLSKYVAIPSSHILQIQVPRQWCIEHNEKQYSSRKIDAGVFFGHGTLFQPWGTDLLPYEIDLDACRLPRKKVSHWVGTIGGQLYGNENEIAPFQKACGENGVDFVYHGPTSTSCEEGRRLIQESYIAPAIHGKWQCDNGYVACRLYKNISYGHLGVTNSAAYKDILGDGIVFNHDTFRMFHDAVPYLQDYDRIMEQMKIVRDKYTYVQAVQRILWALGEMA